MTPMLILVLIAAFLIVLYIAVDSCGASSVLDTVESPTENTSDNDHFEL